ncbi:MAG TPA: ABC transporter permease [Vicinamibacterales bacterium]|jgi:putative ABC transport system permease protein|nr:ABC transporter permease [Vicinamibacterales bacterium]
MDRFAQDLRSAVRKLSAAPAFTLAAVATLAIGIGATTAIFSTVNAALLRPLPFTHPEDLIALRTRYADGRVTTGLIAAAELTRLNASQASIVRAAGFGSAPFDVTLLRENAAPVHAAVYFVGEGFFDLFGLPMTLGGAFTHEQHAPTGRGQGPPPMTVLSHRAWTEMFGSDPQIVGKTVRFAELTATVTGVAARDLDLPQGADFWMNARFDPQDVGHGLNAILRVKPVTTLERLRSELAVAMTGLAHDFPVADAGREFIAQPLIASIVGDLGPILLIVFAATALLLLLACVNVTNLLLGRGAARAREIAVRTALGASRGRIVRQLLTESFVLACLGAIAGLLLALGGVRALQTLGASRLPRLESVPFDAHVLGFASLVLLLSGVMLGLAPAMRLARTDLKTLINESGRSTSGGRGTSRLMGAMTIAEVALALMLVAAAGWLVQSFSRLRATDPGFVAAGRLIVDVRPDPQSVRGPEQTIAWTRALFDRLGAIPGVAHVGSTAAFPLRGSLDASVFVQFLGEAFDPARTLGARMRLVTPGFFDAMGVPIVGGRDFNADDRQNTAPVAIVNREFVRRYLAGKDPLRTRFAFGYPTIDATAFRAIVGVVGDVRYRSIAEDAEPSFYVTQGQFPFPRQTVVVATRAADPSAMAATVRGEISHLEPQLAVDVETASHLLASTLTRQQLGMTLMLLFGATALVLAAVGIYGVIAYASAQRLGEIATRVALGATPRQAFWLLMRRGQWLATAGVLIGLAGAYTGGRAVAGLVYGIHASDPIVLATATLVVVAITWIATAIPAHRAAHVDPILALRGE